MSSIARIDSLWTSLVKERVFHRKSATIAEARHAIFECIEVFIVRKRKHSTLCDRSPAEFEAACGSQTGVEGRSA